jgi:hypothetical protein
LAWARFRLRHVFEGQIFDAKARFK